jgi:hypothetical protein
LVVGDRARAGQAWVVQDSVDPVVRDRYESMIHAFLDGGRAVEQFVDDFLDMWRNDRNAGTRTGEQIDDFMTSIDCFSDSPYNAWDIDEAQLRKDARAAIAALDSR